MRLPITALAGLFLSATLLGCGASPTIPKPPADEKPGPPPGTGGMAEFKPKLKTGQKATGSLGPAVPAKKK